MVVRGFRTDGVSARGVPGGRPAISRIGFWAALGTATAATVFLAVAITTPPRSGPYCRSGCVTYPYTDAAAYVPRDYLWMYPALLTVLAFVALAACLHDRVPSGRRSFSRAGLCFAAIGSGTLVADYGIQLAVMQPGLLSGETAGLSPFSQYNPHGIFIGLEDVGYATLGLALVLLGLALLRDTSKLVRVTGRIFISGGTLTMALLIVYGAIYRDGLAYRFEVISLMINWLLLIIGGLLLSAAFARPRRPAPSARGEGPP